MFISAISYGNYFVSRLFYETAFRFDDCFNTGPELLTHRYNMVLIYFGNHLGITFNEAVLF